MKGRRALSLVVALLLLVLAAATTAPQAAADSSTQDYGRSLGTPPQMCGIGCWGDGTNTLSESYLGTFSLSEHILKPGEEATATFSVLLGSCVNTTPCVGGLDWGAVPGTVVRGCGVHDFTCTFRAPDKTTPQFVTTPGAGPGVTTPWNVWSISPNNPINTATNQQYYTVVSQPVIEGCVKNKSGTGLPGITLAVASQSQAFLTQTDQTGCYYVLVPAGSYVVRPVVGDASGFSPTQASESVADGGTAHADFVYDDQVLVKVSYADSSLQADGFERTTATISTVYAATGSPAPHIPITIEPPLDFVPNVLLCDSTNTRVWPGTLPSGAPDAGGFNETTDSQGQYQMTVWVGRYAQRQLLITAHRTDSTNADESGSAFLTLTNQASSASLPVALTSFLKQDVGTGTASAGLNPSAAQQALLSLLTQIRWNALKSGGNQATASNFEFAPIVSQNGQYAGVTLYPTGSDATPLLDVLNGLRANAPYETQVETTPLTLKALSVNPPSLGGWIFGAASSGINVTPGSILNGAQASSGSSIAHGLAAPGGSGQSAYEYYNYPYEPPATNQTALAQFQACSGAGSSLVVATHSPVKLLFTEPGGGELGFTAQGQSKNSLLGGFIQTVGDVRYYVLPPAGPYTVGITATGSGPATIEVYGYGDNGGSTAVPDDIFHIKSVKAGQKGSFSLSASGPPTGLTFNGHAVTQQAGLDAKLSLSTHTIEAGLLTPVQATLVDQFGRPLQGATVTVTTDLDTWTGITNAQGKTTMSINDIESGPLTFSATAPSVATTTASLTVAPLKDTLIPSVFTSYPAGFPYWLIVVVLVLAVAGYGYWRWRQGRRAHPGAPRPPAPAEVGTTVATPEPAS